MKKFTQEIKDKNTLIRKELNEIKTINNNIIDIIVEIKEKFEQMELSTLNKEEQLLYSIYSANKWGI